MFYNSFDYSLEAKIFSGKLVKDLMIKNPDYLMPEDKIIKAAKYFYNENLNDIPVLKDNGSIDGLITKSHIFQCIANDIDLNQPVSKVMEENIVTIYESNTLLQAWHTLYRTGIGSLFVLDSEGVLVGLLSRYSLISFYENSARGLLFQIENCLHSIHNGVIKVDKNGKIIFLNNAIATILGISREEAVGISIKQLFPQSKLMEVLELGQSRNAQKEEINNTVLLANHNPVFEKGELEGAISIFQKLSELEPIIEELDIVKELSEELDTIIESSYDGIVIADATGMLLKINKAYERITGLDPKTLVGRYVQDVVEDKIVSKSATLEVIKKKTPVTIKQGVITGKEMLVTGSPIFDLKTKKISNCSAQK